MVHYKQPSGLIGENGSIGNETGNVRNGTSGSIWFYAIPSRPSVATLARSKSPFPVIVTPASPPQLLPKHQHRVPGFDERILSLYAPGMSIREIAAHLPEMPGWRSPLRSSRLSPTPWPMNVSGVTQAGSGLLLLHFMFMLFLTLSTNMITKDLIPYA